MMTVSSILLFFSALTYLQANATVVQKGVSYSSVPLEGLRCYKCYRSIHGDACVTMANHGATLDIDQCDTNHTCMVKRYTVDGNLATFARHCAAECTPGCTSYGRYYKIETCYSCCQKNFCNVDNSAQGITSAKRAHWLNAVIAVLGVSTCVRLNQACRLRMLL